MKAMPRCSQAIQHGFVAPVGEVVAVLDADNGRRCGRRPDPRAKFGESDVFDFALCLQVLESSELIVRGHFRVDAVELVERDAVETQAAEAAFTRWNGDIRACRR